MAVARGVPNSSEVCMVWYSKTVLVGQPVSGDELVLEMTSTRYYKKRSATSSTVGRSVALL